MEDAFYQTPQSVQEYINMAKDVSGKELIEKLKLHLPAGSKVLELGSGPGTDWQILSESYQVTGSDFSAEFLKHLIATYPVGDFLQLDAGTLLTDQMFDGIYSNKVLHHLTDEQLATSVKRQHAILHPGAVICHSFWRGEGSEIFKGLFVNYHEAENLRQLFGEYFELLLIAPYLEFEENDSLVLIGRKKEN